MKKNAMLKIAAILMVAVLLTTCAISSTFAKYVTSGATNSASARVAKWGLEITAKANGDSASELFKNTYTDSNSKNIAVGVTSSDLILAPGLSNTGDTFGFTVEGKPEVAVKLIADINVTLDGWAKDASGTYYCPVTFYVNDVAVVATDLDEDDDIDEDDYAAAIEAAMVKALFGTVVAEGTDKKYTNIYAPNTDFSAAGVGDVKVTWAWDNGNDTDDTYLGNQAAAGNAADVSISYNVSAEQSTVGA